MVGSCQRWWSSLDWMAGFRKMNHIVKDRRWRFVLAMWGSYSLILANKEVGTRRPTCKVEVRIYVSHHGDDLWCDKRTGDIHGFEEPWVQGFAVSVRDRILTTSRFTQAWGRSQALLETGATTVVGTPFVRQVYQVWVVITAGCFPRACDEKRWYFGESL